MNQHNQLDHKENSNTQMRSIYGMHQANMEQRARKVELKKDSPCTLQDPSHRYPH